jgi:hypothetical protein
MTDGVFSWNTPGYSTTSVCALDAPLQPVRDPAAPLHIAAFVENASLECGVREVTHVYLDPVPGMVEFLSLSREHFIEVLLSEVTPPPVEIVGVASQDTSF